MEIKPIRTEEDYEQALEQLAVFIDEGEDTPNLDKLEILSVLIGAYEAEHYPVEKPHPVEAIRYYIESRGISKAEFSRQIGVPVHRLGEILNLRRPLSINMIRTIHQVTGISAETLLQPYVLSELITA